MTRLVALFAGLVAGVAAAGIGLGVVIPQVAPDYRSAGLAWAVSAVLIAAAVGLAFFMSRSRRS